MFTGIVTEVGSIAAVAPSPAGRVVVVAAPATVETLSVGDSVSVNGVCLTAVDVGAGSFTVDIVSETLARSGLGTLQPGSRVNLERPLPASGRFDGHIVQGHVDGVAVVLDVAEEGTARRVRLSLPPDLAAHVVEKGSIAVDGVSLTVTAVSPIVAEPWFDVVLIPHTIDVTVLGDLEPGDTANVEVDVIAKYVARILERSS